MQAFPSDQIRSKKRIGSLRGAPVYKFHLVGGLHMIVGPGGPLGVGSHPGVALHLAEEKHPDLVVDELAKAERVDPAHIAGLLPTYRELTQRFQDSWKVTIEG